MLLSLSRGVKEPNPLLKTEGTSQRAPTRGAVTAALFPPLLAASPGAVALTGIPESLFSHLNIKRDSCTFPVFAVSIHAEGYLVPTEYKAVPLFDYGFK